ncbi:MAG: hypothetical protein ACI3W8_06235 [Oscillospiraceae bacterium]
MGFYDSKGYWCNDGDGFYDAKGYFRSPGDGFYDSKGYFRSPGDGFYDSKGYFRSPGDSFYDGKEYLRSSGTAIGVSTPSATGAILGAGFLLSLPIIFLWTLGVFLIEWIAAHPYVIFFGYAICSIFICYAVTKRKQHHGSTFLLSFVGNYLSILSLVHITLLYAVPCVIEGEGSFGSFVEFTLTLLVSIGAIVVLQFFNYFHGKALLECIFGILFFVIVAVILRYNVSTLEDINQIYHLESLKLFRLLIGFMLTK